MATTESSAIARLVDAAQNRGMPGPDGIFEPMDHQPPQNAKPPGKSGSSWWLLVVAVIVIGGSVVGGYVLAQQQGEAANSANPEQPKSPKSAVVAANEPDEVAASAVMPPVPTPVAEVDAALPEEVEEQLEPALDEKELELASKTGFDILVEPKGAKVTLDGHAIGVAPLRVRNLLPGPHQIDIEGPEGYFGQHQEFALSAGEAMVLRLVLDPLSTAAVEESTEEGVEEKSAKKTLTRRERRKAKREAREKKLAEAKKRAKAPNASEKKALAGADKVSLGTLMLGAKPPCEIIINGKKTGLSTPQRSIQLPQGTHRVVLVNKEHNIRKSFKVVIKSGRTTRAIQDLTKKL